MRCAANGGSNLTSLRAVGQFGVSSSAIGARVRPVIIGAACIECQSWRRGERKAPFEAQTASSSWWPAMLSLVFVVHWWIGSPINGYFLLFLLGAAIYARARRMLGLAIPV